MRNLHRNLLSTSLLVILLIACLSSCTLMVRAEDSATMNVTVSIQLDDTGLCLAKQPLVIDAGLSERYGYVDVYDGAEVTALDALVAAHILMFGTENLEEYLKVDAVSGTMRMIAGEDAMSSYFFINGALPDSYTVVDAVLVDDDDLLFYLLQDTLFWSDSVAWFADSSDGVVNSITVGVDEVFSVKIVGYMALWPMFGFDPADFTEPIEDAQIVVLVLDDSAGFRVAWFGEELGLTDANGELAIAFNAPGTYVLSAYDDSGWDMPFIAPWLVVTVEAPEPTVVGVSVNAHVEWLNGPQNRLFITVTEALSDGSTRVIEWNGLIQNNAAGTYAVGNYQVYVNTKGNTQIRECYIVAYYLVA